MIYQLCTTPNATEHLGMGILWGPFLEFCPSHEIYFSIGNMYLDVGRCCLCMCVGDSMLKMNECSTQEVMEEQLSKSWQRNKLTIQIYLYIFKEEVGVRSG